MVPTVEDVFHADTNSTDDYLGEIQSMTILTAIQVSTSKAALMHRDQSCSEAWYLRFASRATYTNRLTRHLPSANPTLVDMVTASSMAIQPGPFAALLWPS